jgi:AcrR family transcriptional regulator
MKPTKPRKTTHKDEPYHHGDLRQTLIDGALDLLHNQGIEPLTLRGVARRCGVTQAAPYHHFKDKAALLAAVAEQGFSYLFHSMQGAARKQRSPRDRLEALGRAYVKFAVTNRAHFMVMFSPSLGDNWKTSPLKEVSVATFELLVDAVKHVLPPKSHLDPTDAALLGWSSMHGLAQLWLDGPIARLGLADKRSPDKLAHVIAHLSARAIMD